MKEKTREKWIDYVKVYACCLVVLGHFFQSMVKSGIMNDNEIYQYFNLTIYYFHVPLFFVCSGYLFQKFNRICTWKEWLSHIKKKGVTLGIPYFTFSLLTLVIKKIFENVVNSTNAESWFEILFNNPISPYWYLYVLFFVFVVTPTASSKLRMNILMMIAIILKGIAIYNMISCDTVYIVNKLFANEIWFVIGMGIAFYEWDKKIKCYVSIILIFLFGIGSVCVYYMEMSTSLMSFILGVIACYVIIGFSILLQNTNRKKLIMDMLGKYTFPIFLMHTIFAAGLRSILMKVGIDDLLIHCILGIGISMLGPILAAIIMERSKWLEIFIYPGKFIKLK